MPTTEMPTIHLPTARIVPLEVPFDGAVADLFQQYLPPGLAPLKLFRTLAHNPRVLQRVFAGNLLDSGSITLRARELVILRTCARCGCDYEWGVHVALFAQHARLSEADLAAARAPAPLRLAEDLPECDALLLDAVDQLYETSTLSEALWSALARHYTPAQILEVIALVGYYHLISFTANAARVEAEDFAPGSHHSK